MSASIETIVKVSITKGTRQVPLAGFGVGLIIAAFSDFSERWRSYGDFEAVSQDVTDVAVLQAAEVYFGQAKKPDQLIIGRIENSETPLQALQAVQAENDTFYAVMVLDHTPAKILAVAGYVETQKKIFLSSSQDAGILATSTSDIAYQLKALNYARSGVIYNASADTVFPEAAWLGRMLPDTPGSETWKFKTLAGVVADNLTGTQITNAQGKNCNLYVTVGGVDITTEGVMADGEYIDTIRFIDWLVSTMEVAVYSQLVNTEKVPYTNKGIAIVESAVRSTLTQGIQAGGLAADPAPVVTVPDALSVPSADKASRTLNNVVFTATLAGAIHKVNIQGFVSV